MLSQSIEDVGTVEKWALRHPVTTKVTTAVNNNVSPDHFELSGIGSDQPMYFVNWEESVSFCEKLGRTFRTPRRWEFVLPTEAQWEYACRAGTTGPYGGTGVVDEMGWIDRNSGRTTHPVGQKKPNALGLHDMHGNVSELCGDSYGDYPREAVVDPKGPESTNRKVRRGGPWGSISSYSRSAGRDEALSHFRSALIGFRVALSSSP